MDAFLNGFMTVFNAIMNAGVYVMLPIIITLLSLLFGLKLSKAFKAGVTIAIGFAGINLVVQLMKDQLGPAAKAMVDTVGIQLDVLDVGWSALASAAWASTLVPVIVLEVIAVNIVMVVLKLTDTMDIDIWNYHSMLTCGGLIFFVTGNPAYALIGVAIMSIITFKFADWTQPFVSHYFGIPGVSLPHVPAQSSLIIAAPLNWLFDKIPGLNKIDIDMSGVRKYLGFFGEPWMLGLILGCVIGALAGYDPGKIFTLGIYMSAVMVLIPRMTQIFVEGLMPVSEAAGEWCQKHFNGRELHIGLDAAVIVGDESVITLTLLMTPITILLAVILPGNRMLPFADLAVIPFRICLILAICRGNMFRSLIIGTVVMASVLYCGTWSAEAMTGFATATGLSFDSGLIGSFCGPSLIMSYIIFKACTTNPVVIIPIILVVFVAVWYIVEKKVGMKKVEEYAAACDDMLE